MGFIESVGCGEKERKERKRKERKEGKTEGFSQGSVCAFLHHSAPFFLEQSLVESKDRLSIKDLGLDLKIWQEHINV